MLDSVTGLSPTVSSRALLFSPTHKRAPFYVRSSNPRAWDELCYWPSVLYRYAKEAQQIQQIVDFCDTPFCFSATQGAPQY